MKRRTKVSRGSLGAALVVGLVVVRGAPLAAQAAREPSPATVLLPGAEASPAAPARTEGPSPGRATLLSFLSTAVPIAVGLATASGGGPSDYGPGIALAGLGAVVGPSAGHFYGGQASRGFASSGKRALAGGIAAAGFAGAWAAEPGSASGWLALAGGTAGAVYFLRSAVRDVARVGDDVRRANESRVPSVGAGWHADEGAPTIVVSFLP